MSGHRHTQTLADSNTSHRSRGRNNDSFSALIRNEVAFGATTNWCKQLRKFCIKSVKQYGDILKKKYTTTNTAVGNHCIHTCSHCLNGITTPKQKQRKTQKNHESRNIIQKYQLKFKNKLFTTTLTTELDYTSIHQQITQ